MKITLEQFVPKSGRNAGKPIPMIAFSHESFKFPARFSAKKIKLILDNADVIRSLLRDEGL